MAYTPIDKSDEYFNTVLYTGTGATLSITGVGFQPDWVWTKGRSVAYSHYLYDSVRGVGNRLISNSTSNEDASVFGVSSFDSDGFTLGTDVGANNNGSTFVGWNWKAGGTAVSNTDGSITSSVSANTTAGFSIVSWTGNNTAGATIGHGLSSTPFMIIVKNRNDVTNWRVYHQALGNTGALALQDTAAFTASTGYWNDTSPTSSLVTLGSTDQTNGTNPMVAYCFADVKGFSKFGSYTGNGSTDGTFVYTGFKPGFVMVKRTDSVNDWCLYDGTRDTYNVVQDKLQPNQSSAESDDSSMDFVSNGFKFRFTGGNFNASGGTYIYMAFAENPFVTSTGIPATAR
jgi:hypothetical protein